MSIRASMDRAITARTAEFSKQFELDHISTIETIAAPAAPVLGQLADALTTQAALNRGGFREGNPVLGKVVQSMPLFFALKLGVGALIGVSVKKLQDQGHKGRARVVSAIGTAAGAGPALWNLKQMGKL